jgi:hypothetical protein
MCSFGLVVDNSFVQMNHLSPWIVTLFKICAESIGDGSKSNRIEDTARLTVSVQCNCHQQQVGIQPSE